MAKMKKLYVVCKLCNKQLTIEVSEDIAKDRDYYPFEYIDIHGDPEHALMLFLDQNLAVREAIAYRDLRIVKQKGNQYKNLIRMSEIDSFESIYTDPVRLQLFMRLTEGPQTEDDLIEMLTKNEGFIEAEFNMVMLPLIKTGLVKTSWLQDSFQMVYFLIKDFMVLRTPTKLTTDLFLHDDRFKSDSGMFFISLNESLANHKQRVLSGKDARIEETRHCLEVRCQLKYFRIFNLLWNGPRTFEELKSEVDRKHLQELIEMGFVAEIKTKTDTYYALLTDIKIKKFTPKYLINDIAQKLEKNEITREMALNHLDFLFEADAK
ncbi:MAG: winged helix-turn-helix transcriptional regulator [Candidatus Helarchaeota archaeon]|nr:winged helix-turn-helix transcriptional regulator [Candidatus Helarchaeota archaeon]